MDLSAIDINRTAVTPRVSWAAIFLKAYGMVSDQYDWLRQSYMPWPIPHIYQHKRTVAMLAIQREHADRPRLCWGRVIDPGGRSLRDLQQQLDQYTKQPVGNVFRKQLRLSRMPWPMRRVAWWLTLNVSGQTRQRQVGTFSLSSLAGQGVNNRDHPTICTSSISYGPLEADGRCLVTVVYDHRMMDGMHAAQALRELKRCLQSEIITELAKLACDMAA